MPLAEIAPRLERRAAEKARATEEGNRLGNIRLILATVTLILILLPLYTRTSGPWWALIAVALAFLVLGQWHARATDRERRAASALAYWSAERDRIEEKWRDFPDEGRDLLPVSSGFDPRIGLAGDLDLFGKASLFQRLSRAVTAGGRRTLAGWILGKTPIPEARARQVAVVELGAKPDFREALAVAASVGVDGPLGEAALLAWGEKPDPLPFGSLLRIVAVLESVALIATAILWALLDRPAPFVTALAVLVVTYFATRLPVASRAALIASPDRALERYAEMLAAIETTTFTAPLLLEVKARLATEGVPASTRVASLRKVVERLESSKNLFFALSLGPATFWDLHLVLAAERWQKTVGPRLRGWLQVIGEVEALASLGAYKAEQPEASMPELVEGEGVYRAEGLAHPLLDRKRAVANDIELGGPGSVLLLSGSNMSGKSTFLRAIGLSAVMAEMGAPVLAKGLRMSPVVLATSIRVVDSLAQGASHFYAELQRIKHVLELGGTEKGRLLYLLDEMLHGTNSKERYIGAVAVIRWLSQHGAVGVVTTHDLSLARVAGELPEERVVNRHFGDEVDGEKIHFDYHLREGAVTSTNALRLMRAIGIDIDLTAPP